MIRDVANQVVAELGLDYGVTLVSAGESGNCEIVMWDRPRDCYFSMKLTWTPNAAVEDVAGVIRERLQQRLRSTGPGEDRRPIR